ncbi:hypothetical protein AKJ08_3594 [Vulgatibacter incomptus]|uniref:Uncharacterized protein n=1 Tax=Vulgatibacter incomptus TaxID=1391653 RepID=A0A0K1PI79_9BACT|nr:hypothetical protein AKJ08_3594 [Vulgatibacter incomptus]
MTAISAPSPSRSRAFFDGRERFAGAGEFVSDMSKLLSRALGSTIKLAA